MKPEIYLLSLEFTQDRKLCQIAAISQVPFKVHVITVQAECFKIRHISFNKYQDARPVFSKR